MAPMPVRDGLDQRRTLAVARSPDGRARDVEHRVGVVPVHEDGLQAVRGGPVRRGMLHRRHRLDRRVLHIEVVLAHEHDRQAPDGRQVQRLVERPDVRGAVTEETDGDLPGAPHLGRPRRPGGDRQMRPDDRVGTHHPVRDAGEVHRAALPSHQAALAAEQLCHHGCHRHASSEGVVVSPVGAERVVVGAHRDAVRRGDRLLTESQVARPLHQVLQEQVVGALLEGAQPRHQPVQLDPAGIDAGCGWRRPGGQVLHPISFPSGLNTGS